MSDSICGHRQTVANRTFVCVREDHSWAQEAVADYRRRAGKVISPDRHYFVRLSS